MLDKGINVLSLFDGLSGARLALNKAGITVDKYYKSEIDKYACQVSAHHFSEDIQLGDVAKWREWNLEKPDLIIGGSPCQDLSIAKRDRKGLSGERSGLFWDFVDILKHYKPKYFLVENVASMPNKDKEIISDILEVDPIMINSALVSAQQRKRLYWTNIPDIIQPKNKDIRLVDILEVGAITEREKSLCITSTYANVCITDYIKKHSRQLVFDDPDTTNRIGIIGRTDSQGNRVYSTNGKSVSLSVNGGGMGAKTGLYICCASRGRNIVNGKRKDILGAKTNQRLEFRNDNKTNCLTTVAKDNYIANLSNLVIRKLTIGECERLQTVPTNYLDIEGISTTQKYRMLGNGFTIAVIAHLLQNIGKPPNTKKRVKLNSFF